MAELTETQKQIASVMLQHGTTAQAREVLEALVSPVTASAAMHERDVLRMRVEQLEGAYEDLRLVAVRAVHGVKDLASAPDRGGADRIVREDALNELDELYIACSRAAP